MVIDMDALMAAADALADANEASWAHDGEPTLADIARILDALTAYRAAREAVTRGTPPAFATSA